ncbi:TPA: DUF262 domain-containing protein [Vibrio cholerae]|uniref:DUF262 domain-containing protein n=1 Tax=Vibrio cholerae TaxID=666 RepID=UPI0021D2EF1E|nr:DUF262 domain-containing HNH endonuclease family protein [Vibrio cholerae]MCU4218727.1 DUF262 domain-containing HNH endonuclease family protein [Vibrio cholerae]HCZ9577604.1 DUF262 domain-containing protein [Vibrio cholerae]HCZ9602569.1 DUF262 domain-containing protein [Vibrio cholerae]HCZ9606218.1 DUF262 domain-containing protein [Vibrio cholerae]HCZ9638258.1 DUF262 domain-containing protein [Vibrio cholerae]
MKIEANDKEIQDIFSSGYFQIPRFQRPYSWGREEVENFWNDIIDDKTDSYFIGSMVVYQTRKPYFGIVDGQQRLTTITIVLSVIRDAFIKLGETNLAKGMHKFIETPNNDFVNEFVLNAETSFPYLQQNIQSFKDANVNIKIDCEVGVEEVNLKSAYELLSSKLEELIPLSNVENKQLEFFAYEDPVLKLKDLRDKFLSLKLVFIQLDNEDDAYLIFETLNARGRDLKTSDFVKNLLLKTIKINHATLDGPKEAWNSLVKKFDDISEYGLIDTYLLHYWISKHEYSTDKKLFALIKDHVTKGTDNAKLLLEDLRASASSYCKMLSPESGKWTKEQSDIKDSLIALNSFKVKQQSSFVLSLLVAYSENRITIKQVKNIIKRIEHFHFVFNAITQQRSSGSIATMYSQHAINLSSANNNDDIQRILSSLTRGLEERMPSYDEFEVKFLELNYLSNKTRSKNVIKYSLCKLLGSQSNGLDINHVNLTIEHLIPESYIKKDVDEGIIGNIGNLVLTDARTNGHKLKNKDPMEKIALLKTNGYPLDTNFLNVGSWDKTQVEIRAKKIAKYVYTQV